MTLGHRHTVRRRHNEVEITSGAAPMYRFQSVFKAAIAIPDKPVICVCMGKLLSATLQKATDARATLPAEQQKRITILDSGCVLIFQKMLLNFVSDCSYKMY